ERWESLGYNAERFKEWINKDVTEAFNKKAACRVFHICKSGKDVEITNPFATADATEKPVKFTVNVPGSPEIAQNLFDVSQALSWVATKRRSPEEQLDWQTKIPRLLSKLSVN